MMFPFVLASAPTNVSIGKTTSKQYRFDVSNQHDGKYALITSMSNLEIYYFTENYIRPVSKVVDSISGESWFIMSENLKDWVEIDPSQLWFWTKEWQEGEKQVEIEREQGQSKHFKSVDDLIGFLNK